MKQRNKEKRKKKYNASQTINSYRYPHIHKPCTHLTSVPAPCCHGDRNSGQLIGWLDGDSSPHTQTPSSPGFLLIEMKDELNEYNFANLFHKSFRFPKNLSNNDLTILAQIQ